MPKALPVDWSGIAVLAASGVTLDQLAEQTGVNINTLKARCRREGWKTAVTTQRTAQVETAVAAGRMKPVAVSGAQVAANTLADDSRETKLALSRAIRKGAKHAETMDGAEVVRQARNVHELSKGASGIHGWDSGDDGPGRISIYGSQVVIMPEAPDTSD